jgi:hypothetical protein
LDKKKKKKNKQASKIPTTPKHVGKQLVTNNHIGSVDGAKITQTTHKPKYPCRLCKRRNLLKDCPCLSKVIKAWSTHPLQSMFSAFEQHVDDLPSISQDIIGKMQDTRYIKYAEQKRNARNDKITVIYPA